MHRITARCSYRALAVAGRGLLFTLIAVGTLHADALKKPRAVFEREWKQIDAEYATEHEAVLDKYAGDLKKLLAYMERRGDEFGIDPTQREIDRFAGDRTVPVLPEPGLPLLIEQARTRYRKAKEPVDASRTRKRDALIKKYVGLLSQLMARLNTAGKAEAVLAVKEEIARATNRADGAASGPQLVLPGNYGRGLAVAWVFAQRQGTTIPDLSGGRSLGQLIGTQPIEGTRSGLNFTSFQDVLETEHPVKVRTHWTMDIAVKFPLTTTGRERVLASGGFREDHVVVSKDGKLGVNAAGFASSGYSVDGLEGWHHLTVIANRGKTAFFLDGEQVGVAEAACETPLTAIGNSAAYSHPWGGGVKSVFVWTRLLSMDELKALPGHLTSVE